MFKKLFPAKSRQSSPNSAPVASPTPPQKGRSAEQLSRLFVSSMLGQDDHDSIGRSNQLDQALLQKIRAEINQPNVNAIPKLAQASVNLMKLLMDENVASDELVRVVEEDPVLLGKVLELANSAFYKSSKADIESLKQALVMLGNDGLKRLVLSTLLADKMRISTAYFRYFGANIWKHSHNVAVIASALSGEQGGNAFIAYFNGLIHDIGKLVIFRLLIEVLEGESPDAYPSAGFFAKLIDLYGHKLTLTVLREWALSPEWIKPILTYQSGLAAEKMTPDGRSLYIANLCAEYHYLHSQKQLNGDELNAALQEKGIDPDLYQRLSRYC